MARRVMGTISLALALVSILSAHHASAQPSGCTSAIVSLAPCLNYITGNSSTPTASCCTSLASVVKTQAQCLCALLNNGAAQFGLNINQTLALTLPGACKVQTPPLSQCNGASAQSDCTTALISLSPCLNYISGNDSTPSGSCCKQLASVVKSEPQCLCTVLNGGGSSLGITINQTQALALPEACNLQTPPSSRCNDGGGGPSASPISPSSPSTPGVVPSGGGSKTVPSVDSNSGSCSANVPFSLVFSFLFVAAYTSAPLAGF